MKQVKGYEIQNRKKTSSTITLFFLTAIVVNKLNCLFLIKEKNLWHVTQLKQVFYPFQNSCLVTKLLLIIKILTNVLKSVNWCQILVRQHDVEKNVGSKTRAAFLDH